MRRTRVSARPRTFAPALALGGNFEVLSTKIFFAVIRATHDQGRAATLAIVLLGSNLLAFWVQYVWLGKRNYTTVTGKGDAGAPLMLPRHVAWLCFTTAIPLHGSNRLDEDQRG